jgi:hypothetical protein
MPIRCTSIVCLFLVLLFVPATRGAAGEARQDSAAPAVSGAIAYSDASTFAAELRRIGNAIETEKAKPTGLAFVRKGLPSHWGVTTGEHHYYLSAEPLNALLRDAEKAKDAKSMAANAREAADWAFDLANQVNAYARAQTDAASSTRAALERILSRREFGGVKGPSAWDLFRRRISRWILEVLSGIFRQIGRYPMGATVLFWLIIVAVVLWLALVLFRYWTRRAALEELQVPDSVAFARTWQEWIQTAREAAKRGDYREAVHSAYWAGISFLEDSEVVRKDRTRTPREYMRLVSNSTQLVATGRKTREALSALTVVLEQVWYGGRPANNQDFANALQSVEALGCQLQ